MDLDKRWLELANQIREEIRTENFELIDRIADFQAARLAAGLGWAGQLVGTPVLVELLGHIRFSEEDLRRRRVRLAKAHGLLD